jgi:hypothetical protein
MTHVAAVLIHCCLQLVSMCSFNMSLPRISFCTPPASDIPYLSPQEIQAAPSRLS